MSITNYEVLSSLSPADLAAQVAGAIGNSWQPYGHLVITKDGRLNQAMIQGSQVLVGATGATGAAGADGTVKTFYGTSASVASAYTITIAGGDPVVGNFYAIKLTHAPQAATTWNINGTGAKPVVLPNGNAINGPQGVDGQIFVAVYDGTSFVLDVTPNNA